MRFIYSVLWWFCLPFVLLRLYIRGNKEKGYRQNIGERLGTYCAIKSHAKRIWIHAVSVGETRAAEPLILALLNTYSDAQILLTHMTPTGRATGHALFKNFKDTNRLIQCYLPYDMNVLMQQFLRHFKPRLGIIMETEIWPNLVFNCIDLKIPLALVNARLSEKSLKKGKKFQSIMQEISHGFTLVAAQTQTDALRLKEFGANSVHVTGSVKFDVSPPDTLKTKGKQFRKLFGHKPVLMCASTRDGEELQLLNALDTLHPDALVLLVPRHPQRFNDVAQLLSSRQIPFIRRSTINLEQPLTSIHQNTRVILGDSMGEMFMYYAACDIAFIGGSLENLGGQNLIEACALGKPVLIGPHTFNFEAITKDAINSGCALRIHSAQEVMQKANHLFDDKVLQQAMGEKSLTFAQSQHGATEKTLQLLHPLIS